MTSSNRKIGVIGGTFDPVHLGHLVIAEEARCHFGLDKLMFMLSAHPPHKDESQISRAEIRLEMLKRAIADNPYFEISDLELARSGKSYTVDTVKDLKDRFGSETEIYFIMGTDSLLDMDHWKEPNRIFELLKVVVAERPGFRLAKAKPEFAQHIVTLDVPVIGVSSTEIRNRVAEGRSIRYLVPESVIEFIEEERLYIPFKE